MERQTRKIKELSDKNSKIMDNSMRLQDEITVLNDKYTQKIRELREAENKKVTY